MEKSSFNDNRINKYMRIERRIFNYAYHVPERRKRANRKKQHSFISKDHHHHEPAQLKHT